MERASVKCTWRCMFGMGGFWHEVAQLVLCLYIIKKFKRTFISRVVMDWP